MCKMFYLLQVNKIGLEKERAKKILEQNAANLFPIGEDAAITSSDTVRTLIKNKMAVKLDAITEVANQDFSYIEEDEHERRHAQDPALEHLLDNVAALALNSDHREISTLMSTLSLYPQLEEFARKIIEKRYEEEIAKNKLDSSSSSDSLPNMCDLNGMSRGKPDQKLGDSFYRTHPNPRVNDEIVSFQSDDKQNESSHQLLLPLNPVNFKEMIVQYMGQKNAAATLKDEQIHLENETATACNKPQEPGISLMTQNSGGGKKAGQGKKRTGSPLNSGGKGSRPKRGKYRNYAREKLLQAVQAVQSGEMSVHRAGSLYGVPHSTLEYKVKERHLNRGRSKKEAKNSNNSGPSSGKTLTQMPSRPTMVPTNSFMDNNLLNRKLSSVNSPDSNTIDLTKEPYQTQPESVLDSQPAAKKRRITSDSDDEGKSSFGQSIPFSLWNSSSSLLPSFISNPYEQDSFYASQMIRKFQEAAASSSFTSDKHLNAPSISNENASPTHDHSSGSCSPNLEKVRQGPGESYTSNSVLDALLRGKSPMEASSAATIDQVSPSASPDFNLNPWSVSSRLLKLSKQLASDNGENDDQENKSTATNTPGFSAFSALCSMPSVLGLQNSLAAALQRQISPNLEALTQKQDFLSELPNPLSTECKDEQTGIQNTTEELNDTCRQAINNNSASENSENAISELSFHDVPQNLNTSINQS